MSGLGEGLGGTRTPTEFFDYIAESPGKRLGLPLGMAALSGELDEPLPEAPAGPSRTPFTPKDFDFTRNQTHPTPVSYTHLTLPTIYSV